MYAFAVVSDKSTKSYIKDTCSPLRACKYDNIIPNGTLHHHAILLSHCVSSDTTNIELHSDQVTMTQTTQRVNDSADAKLKPRKHYT